jgi:hypothetical protein
MKAAGVSHARGLFLRTFAQERVAMSVESKLGKLVRALLGRKNRGDTAQPAQVVRARPPAGKSKRRQTDSCEVRDIGSLVL